LGEGLLELKNMLPENCQLKVLLIPHCAAVDARYQERFAALGAHFDSNWNTTELQSHSYPTVSYLDSISVEGMEIIDLLSAFQSEDGLETPLYFNNDPHLNASGQLKLASFALQQLDQ